MMAGEPEPLALHWWSLDAKWATNKRIKRDWYGVAIANAAPVERKAIDWWLMKETRLEDRFRTRTETTEDERPGVGDFRMPHFCVYLRHRDARVRLEAMLRRFPKRTLEGVLPAAPNSNVNARLRRVKNKWIIRGGEGAIVSMAPCRDAEAALILIRLIGTD
jgi:hypothetical protein